VRHLRYITDPATGRRYAVPAGGSTDAPPPAEGGTPSGEGATPPAGDQQGDGGQGADAGPGTEEWKSPESKAAALADLQAERDRRRQLEAELQQFRTAEQERERDAMDEVERARAEGRDEGLAEGHRALRRAAAMVAAAQPAHPFHDAEAAVALLGSRLDEVTVEGGQVDTEAVTALVAELAESKPWLVRTTTERTPGPPDLNGGGGGTPPGEPQDADAFNAQLRREFSRS
jgi:hypothetical protein